MKLLLKNVVFLLGMVFTINVFAVDQFRLGGSLFYNIDKNWSVLIAEELKWTDEFYYHHTNFGVKYFFEPTIFSDGLTLVGTFRNIFFKKDGKWTDEQYPYITVIPKWKLPYKLELSLMNELEYRYKYDVDLWRYSIRPLLLHTSSGLFIGSNLKYNISSNIPEKSGNWNNNEVDVGIIKGITKNVKVLGWYRFTQSYQENRWVSGYDQIGVELMFNF